MKKLGLVFGLILSIICLSGCATKPVASKPLVNDDDNSSVQTAPAKTMPRHIDYKGESLNK